MHMLMSYIGAVGTLRSNTGLEELMQSTFGGVPKMLTGKKFPQNARALRMVVEVVLKEIIQKTDTHNVLMAVLEERASRSRTTKMWLDNIIKPGMIMMTFIRAEREGIGNHTSGLLQLICHTSLPQATTITPGIYIVPYY